MSWDSKRDPEAAKHPDTDPNNTFERRRAYYREKHPEWFKDEEAEAPDRPVTNATLRKTMEGVTIEVQRSQQAIQQTIREVLRWTSWLGWGVAVFLGLLLARH
jgi:hypothetical protein